MSKFDFYFLEFDDTKHLFGILDKYSIDARFVGGCVRDALLGMPTNDFDIAVNKNIIDLMNILEKSGISCIATGLKYGSITAIVNNTKFELTELRRDVHCLGRRCTTENISTFEEDAKRRDFTINALYVSKDGELFDYFDGLQDLQRREVIFIGNPEERIQEDYLRILRYYRFAAKLSDFSDRYSGVIQKFADKLNLISIERIQKELFSILDYDNHLTILKYISNNNVFKGLNLQQYSELIKLYPYASIELKTYILFDINTLLHRFKLNKVFKNCIKAFKLFENESLLYCAYKKGNDFAEQIRIIKRILYDKEEPFEKLINPPKFPLKYEDLAPTPSFASRRLKACERWWVCNFFTPSKEDCLNFLDINENF